MRMSWVDYPPQDRMQEKKPGFLGRTSSAEATGAAAGGRTDCYNNRMSQSPDVLILGGGVIGLTTAYFLGRGGARVEALDQADFGREASWAGAGILPPGNPAAARTAFDRLRAYSVGLFPALSAELRERTGIDNGYLRCGGLEFAGAHAADQEWRGEGVTFEQLDPDAARRLEPSLAANLGPACH